MLFVNKGNVAVSHCVSSPARLVFVSLGFISLSSCSFVAAPVKVRMVFASCDIWFTCTAVVFPGKDCAQL